MNWLGAGLLLLALTPQEEARAARATIEVQEFYVAAGDEVQAFPAGTQFLLLTNRLAGHVKFQVRCRGRDGRSKLSTPFWLSYGAIVLARLHTPGDGAFASHCTPVRVRLTPPEPSVIMPPLWGLAITNVRLVRTNDFLSVSVTLLNYKTPSRHPREGRILCRLHSSGRLGRVAMSDRIALEPDEKREIDLVPRLAGMPGPINGINCDVIGTEQDVRL